MEGDNFKQLLDEVESTMQNIGRAGKILGEAKPSPIFFPEAQYFALWMRPSPNNCFIIPLKFLFGAL